MFEPNADRTVTLSDGRPMAFCEWGVRDGPVVVMLHGTPHSRLWCPDVAGSIEAGCRVITVDRPGYGGSIPPPEMSLRAWISDLNELVDQLGIDRCGVIGWSGGAIHALACAALIPHRLLGAGSLGGAGWPVDQQPGALDALSEQDRRVYDAVRQSPDSAVDLAAEVNAGWLLDIGEHPEQVDSWLSAPADLRHFEDPVWAERFYCATREAVRQGPRGYAWDVVTCFRPWGFDLSDVGMDFHIWRGSEDNMCDPAEVDFWADRLPHAHVHLVEGYGHFLISDRWPEILATLIRTG